MDVDIWESFVRFGVDLGTASKKHTPKFPKNWQKITTSIYKDEPNFAVLTGKINNIVVIDIDNKNDIPGLAYFNRFFKDLKQVNTLVTKSWSNGYHIFFKYDSRIKSTSFKNFHIDIQSDGKCVYQGKNYEILYDNSIRELTEDELSFFTFKHDTSIVEPNVDIESHEKELLQNFIEDKYKFFKEEIRDIFVDQNIKSIIVALDSTRCPFIKRLHKSNHQYIVFNARGSKQRCHDPECKDNIYGEIKRLPKNIKQIINKYVPTNKDEEKL